MSSNDNRPFPFGSDGQSFPRTFPDSAPPQQTPPQQTPQPAAPAQAPSQPALSQPAPQSMPSSQQAGYGTYQPESSFTPQPARAKKGPTWGGVITVAAVTALVAGGIGAGATAAIQSTQRETTQSEQVTSTADEKIKTTEVPD